MQTDDELSFEIATATMAGDLRDGILRELEVAHTMPWNARAEAEQRAVVDRVSSLARAAIRDVVNKVVNAGFPALVGTLASVAVKDGYAAKVEIPKGAEHRHELMDAEGSNVVLVLADPSTFFKTRGAVKITPDQPPLPYAQEAARVADAAETPPEGWVPVPCPEAEGDDAQPAEEAVAPAEEEDGGDPTASPPREEGLLMDDEPAFAAALEGMAKFTVKPIADAKGVWHCWKDGQGDVRCHEDPDVAAEIAARQKEEDEDAAWDDAETRQAKGRKRRRGAETVAAPA